MAYVFENPTLGLPPITSSITATDTTAPLPWKLGDIQRAVDPTLGGGEFIYLLGVDSTIVGSVVRYNATTYQTALVTGVPLQKQATPVAVAMSANTSGKRGWYQISGLAVIKKTAVAFGANVPIYTSATAGRIKALTSNGMQVVGATTANLATISAGVSTITVAISRPHLQAQIT